MATQKDPELTSFHGNTKMTLIYKETIDDKGVDYIDYAEITGKGVCYVSDYDTPFKLAKVQRDKVKMI